MTEDPMTIEGFHEGELAMQRAAGVEQVAARRAGMLATPHLGGALSRFLAERDFAVLAARDAEGVLWASPLFEEPGFLVAEDRSLTMRTHPRAGDPLDHLPVGAAVGLIAVEFATRRRVRVNGTLVHATADALRVEVDQAFGNCPQYIQRRQLRHGSGTARGAFRQYRWDALPADLVDLVTRADTFFLGTTHPTRGADASHRGGSPGFVRVDGPTLWWPDYPGNDLFNSLGNLTVDDTAALLFIDFATGTTLQLTGTAHVELLPPGSPGDDGASGRRVRFTPEQVIVGPSLAFSSERPEPSPYNPTLT
jgi:predicted pyridoxine 5'-phosphate oxidase superfamily flavin-nucleotide-binding protein